MDYRGSAEKEWTQKEINPGIMDHEILIIIIVAIFHIIQAVVGGWIAVRRGKSFWIWFVVCFLIFFPFGWIWMLKYTKEDFMP